MCKNKPEFFGNSLEIVNDCLHFKKLFEYGRNLFVSQDFVSIKEGRKEDKFRSLEVQEASSLQKNRRAKSGNFVMNIFR